FLALYEAEPPELVKERDMIGRIAWAGVHATETINPSGLLCARRYRPRNRCAAEQRDELAPPDQRVHSITSSASESRLSEILTPSALAVLRLITVSNLVGCSTGRSAGFAALRIRAGETPYCRYASVVFSA